MGVVRIDVNGDKKIDLISWKMECDENLCQPVDVKVLIATPLENSGRTRLVPIEELEKLRYYNRIISREDPVEKRGDDVERVVYAFSFRLEKIEPVFSTEVLLWGLQLCLKVKPVEDIPNRKASIRRLGDPIFHPDLFRLP